MDPEIRARPGVGHVDRVRIETVVTPVTATKLTKRGTVLCGTGVRICVRIHTVRSVL